MVAVACTWLTVRDLTDNHKIVVLSHLSINTTFTWFTYVSTRPSEPRPPRPQEVDRRKRLSHGMPTDVQLMPDGDHGVDAGGAAGRDLGGEQRNGTQDGGRRQENDGVGAAYPIEHSSEHLAEQERERETGSGADGGQGGALAHHQAQGISTARAEGHADADFARAAGHGVGKDAIQADHGQHQGGSPNMTVRPKQNPE